MPARAVTHLAIGRESPDLAGSSLSELRGRATDASASRGDTVAPAEETAAVVPIAELPPSDQIPPAVAELGRLAPEFTLTDHAGRAVALSSFRGHVVVLEWFNPECPLVAAAHTEGTLAGPESPIGRGDVVWLAINSGAPGRQGSSLAANLRAREEWGLDFPILFDESGAVGLAYRATATPQIFVIDAKGVLVYSGALDNAQDGTPGPRFNYVRRVLRQLEKGMTVMPSARTYGCEVKYAVVAR